MPDVTAEFTNLRHPFRISTWPESSIWSVQSHNYRLIILASCSWNYFLSFHSDRKSWENFKIYTFYSQFSLISCCCCLFHFFVSFDAYASSIFVQQQKFIIVFFLIITTHFIVIIITKLLYFCGLNEIFLQFYC